MLKCFNIYSISGKIPQWWNLAKTILIDKGHDTKNINNYRLICLQCISSKIFTKIINSKLMNVIKTQKILEPEQKGFINRISGCEDHIFTILSIIDDMNSGLDNNELTLLILQLSKLY